MYAPVFFVQVSWALSFDFYYNMYMEGSMKVAAIKIY